MKLARPPSTAALGAPRGGGASPPLMWVALLIVYVVWGSTYLAIAIAIETTPPLLMASFRFLCAGSLLWLISDGSGRRRGIAPPSRAEWRAAAVSGTALLLGGNGAVVLAEQWISSGVAALMVATIPMWMALIANVWMRERLSAQEALGIALGFGGVVLLVTGRGDAHVDRLGALILVVGSLSWAAGSLYARRAPHPARATTGAGMQMLCGSVALAVAGLVHGEASRLRFAAISGRSALALAYLILVGALVAYTAYAWLNQNARTSIVGTYAYVNPVVAVVLGAAILDEPLTARILLAGAVILVGVAMIVLRPRARLPAEGPAR